MPMSCKGCTSTPERYVRLPEGEKQKRKKSQIAHQDNREEKVKRPEESDGNRIYIGSTLENIYDRSRVCRSCQQPLSDKTEKIIIGRSPQYDNSLASQRNG